MAPVPLPVKSRAIYLGQPLMTESHDVSPPTAMDVRQLARASDTLAGLTPLSMFQRWHAGAPDGPLPDGVEPLAWRWAISAEVRVAPGGQEQVWMHLVASGEVPQVCQRCLSVYLEPLTVDRWFRFVRDEATAEAEDEVSDEDVLVWTPHFNLHELIEDELLLALPLVPMHGVCPDAPQAALADPSMPLDERPHPFAALAGLKAAGRSTTRRDG